MMHDLARNDRARLANQTLPAYSLARKRCACVLADVVAAILPDDTAKRQHMLGVILDRYPKSKWGFRNHLCAGAQHDPKQPLVATGLAITGHIQSNGSTYFHSTVIVCKVAGISAAGIKRVMEE